MPRTTSLDCPRYFLAAANGVDWREFVEQHPHLAYAHQEFVWRFAAGLIPTLPYETRALYRTLLTDRAEEVSELRAALASGGLSAVAERIAESDWSAFEQVVLVRKLLGRAECSLHQAADLVAAIQPRLVRDAGDYRGLGDPHRIATALAPYISAPRPPTGTTVGGRWADRRSVESDGGDAHASVRP
ncbi:hypothetical protein [Nocardia sp. CA-119907]|uniref:hypothetical protein n=1 Tax=Nocardia sp. CA-119907 TaxID=3239973 RepID=UPI003D980FEA